MRSTPAAESDVQRRAVVAVEKARDVLDQVAPERVEKTLWGSPAGKKRLAKRLAAMLPPHRTYVEPFCGSAAVLFAKERSRVEVINDADVELAQAYRLVKRMTADGIKRLKRMRWVGDRAAYKRLLDSKPTGDVEKLHRFLYVTHFSYGKMRGRSFSPSGQGIVARSVDRLEKHGPRLKHVRVYDGDYLRVVRKYDGPHTAFFLDPPYPGYDVAVGESKFDEERFFEVLKSLKGKFLLTYGVRGKLPGLLKGSGFHVKRIQTPRTIRSMRGVGGPKTLTQLVVTNYAPVKKQLDALKDAGWGVEDWELEGREPREGAGETTGIEKDQWSQAYINDLEDSAFLHIAPGGEKDDEGKTTPRSLRHFPVRDVDGELDIPHLQNAISRIPQSRIPSLSADDLTALQEQARQLLAGAQKKGGTDKAAKQDGGAVVGAGSFSKTIPLIKGVDPQDERFVLGIVLEPEVVDAQGDIYSAEEIRQAAHRFMEEFGGLGLMHRLQVNGQVRILESYLAPVDFEIGEVKVRRGTWLLAVRILSDELWARIKDGTLGGFSVGGSARRIPETAAADEASARGVETSRTEAPAPEQEAA